MRLSSTSRRFPSLAAARLLLFTVVLAGFSGLAPSVDAQALDPETLRKVKNLHAFAKLYGYTRYFNPSDEAAQIDWDAFAIHGAERILAAADRDALQAELEALFLPITPALEILALTDTPSAPPQPATTEGMELVAWQHLGVDLGLGRGPYRSVRVGRELRKPAENAGFGPFFQNVPAEPYRGHEIRLRAAVRAAPGSSVQLWLRIDREERQRGFFDNMADRPITETDWKVYEILGTVDEDAVRIALGGMLRGQGVAFFDAFELVSRASADDAWETIEISDPGFEASTENLGEWSALAKGYLYAKAAEDVFAGERSARVANAWVSEPGEPLFDAMPDSGEVVHKVLADGLAASFPIALWSDAEGTLPRGDSDALAALQTDLSEVGAWDSARPGHRAAPVLVAWSTFQHFYPYFDEVGSNWEQQLIWTLRDVLEAGDDRRETRDLLRKLTTALVDGHVGVQSQAPEKIAVLPLDLAYIEGQVVVVESQAEGVERGDVILKVDGERAAVVLNAEERLTSGSAQFRRYRAVRRLGSGPPDTEVHLELRRGYEDTEATVTRIEEAPTREFSDRAAMSELEDGVRYVDLRRVDTATLVAAIDDLTEAPAVIFDLRGYPGGSPIRLFHHFLPETLRSPRWNVAQTIYPDRERIAGWNTEGRWELEPLEPRFENPVVFLTDARALSFAESLLGIVEHYRLAEIVGQPTAGVNGNVNLLNTPGGFQVSFTGMRVLKHDGSQHHLIGIEPTVWASRTVEGVREGRDEVLERALAVIRAKQSAREGKASGGR